MADSVSHPRGVKGFLAFVNNSPTPFHAVANAKKRLSSAGFKEIRESDDWSKTIRAGDKYYLTRNGSSIVAFAVGGGWRPGNPIAMIGAHTDSPCLRIKPVSKKQNDGFLQVGVETYGGGLWHTWFDRDLSIAGRVMVRSKGLIESRLIKIDRPILRIPTLAIHLDPQETFSFNKETQLFPIAGMVAAELNRTKEKGKSSAKDDSTEKKNNPVQVIKTMTERHHPYIVELIANEAGVDPSDVVDFEMLLYDTQPACLGGINNELIFSARLDNLMMSFCGFVGLLDSVTGPGWLNGDTTIRLLSLFDHEEIGSRTAQGADSTLLPAVLRRLSLVSLGDPDRISSSAYEQSLATSFLISADMAHSVHPNYPTKYESDHRPEMNQGVVIKINANARYATNSPGIVLMQEVAREAARTDEDDEDGVPLQLFVVRNDSRCGSTIGPMLSAALGTRTLDVGNPQLSMHSIRETGGAYDVNYAIRLFSSFYRNYSRLGYKIRVD
ncbi:MAG: Glucose-repressible alcohol dehydrogenase transcriptional effector [Watsoniomyces obsoletus]|nr:MAG: Glucose-repressible alcohol dehydrogenase transcriptional effector [Watsoniomyces obsoletus]